nr:unnamed protein product [Callosobruchus analis]
MVITREIRDEIKLSVSSSINSILKNDEFLDQLVQKVMESIAKTLEAKFIELEKKVADNGTGIMELKEETALLKCENECLLQKIDAFDQMSGCNNLQSLYK